MNFLTVSSIQFLTALLTFVIASSSPIPKRITDEIKADNCLSPSKNFLSSKNVTYYCDIPDTTLTDSRSILCRGLLDLHTTFCSKAESSGGSFTNVNLRVQQVVLPQESVPDFCNRWRSKTQASKLLNLHSFQSITKMCERVCEGVEKELNILCPLLLSGSQMLLKTPKASISTESKKEVPLKNSGVNIPSSLIGEKVEVKSGGPEITPVKPQVDENTPSEVEIPKNNEDVNPYPRDESELLSAVMHHDTKEPAVTMKETPKPVEESFKAVDSKISNAENDAEKVVQNNEKLGKINSSINGSTRINPDSPAQPADALPVNVLPVNGQQVETSNSSSQNSVVSSDSEGQKNPQLQETQNSEKTEAVNKTAVLEESKPNLEAPEVNNDKPINENENSPPANPSKPVINLDDSNPNLNVRPVKVNNDFLEEGYDDEASLNQNSVAELQSSQQDFPPQGDVFVEAEDSHFFQYFMIVSAAFILGYVILVNKKKLIALVVEGRRDGSRRRHHSASYSKLDSNLEEALSSNRTTVSSHQVLY